MLWAFALGCSGTSAPRRMPAAAPPPERASEIPAASKAQANAGDLAPGDEDTPAKPVGPAPPAEPTAAPAKEKAAFDPALSTSIGNPADGRLEGGVALPSETAAVRFNDRRDSDARFGTAEVISAIVRAAQQVHDDLPPAQLTVNDISLEHGGPIDHHGSHRAGRDADILFYLLGDDGKPLTSVGAPLDPDGVGFDFKDLAIEEDDVRVHFDAPRTWRFVAALLSDPDAHVQRIFVVEHLRAMMLRAATSSGADPAVRERFEEITCQPSYPHDDHLHVRWFCSDEDLGKGCRDLPPMYPWREQQLAEAGLEPLLGALRRGRARSKIVTNEEEDRKVAKNRQKIHRDVHAFLARRKKWRVQPHPGRKYCR